MDDNDDVKRVVGFIPNERMGEFKRKIDLIQSQARKLELPEWDVSIGEKEWRPVRVITEDASGFPVSRTMELEGSPVSIVGDAPVLAGWRFLAKIEHDVGGNLVKSMVGDDISPADWHSCGPNCDHCSVSRQRNNTYMLKNIKSGDVKQVGSSCVSDFLGAQYRDPERIAAMYDYLMEIGSDFEYDPDREVGGGVGLTSCGIRPEILMATVLKIIQEDGGYISSDKAEALNCANTGDRLRAAFWNKKPVEILPDAGHLVMAPQIVAWLTEQKGVDSLWMRNIAYLASRPGIACNNAGLFASGYVAWNLELQRQLRAERGVGDWVGESGAKIAVSATLERHAGFETAFGYKTVLSFRDEDGNALTWKTQSPPHGLVVGSNYHLIATVKSHGVYKNDKQTEITRAKIPELELFSRGSMAGYKKLAAVATPDVIDERGHTPLLQAVWADSVDHAKVLLAAGADANQVNQGEVPMLAYAISVEMAQLLLASGARAVDVTGEWLKGMTAETRDVVVAAMPVLRSLEPMEVTGAVCEGEYSGMIMEIVGGAVVQRVNRDGETVRHDAVKLSGAVKEGDVVDIKYRAGRAEVKETGKELVVGR